MRTKCKTGAATLSAGIWGQTRRLSRLSYLYGTRWFTGRGLAFNSRDSGSGNGVLRKSGGFSSYRPATPAPASTLTHSSGSAGVSSSRGGVVCGDLCVSGSRPVTGSACSAPCSGNLAVNTGLCAPCGSAVSCGRKC